ncbi:DUF4845 domain-containing protein, partial [Dokdonella sp.]|uniref:DUF4845 domain-containing protein n=1 Tax=Dokdonella sp. TaxID=2291710 RepID=UPI003C592225
VGFFGYLAMRLIPMYVEYMGVVRAMEQLKDEPNARNLSPEEVRRNLSLKFNTQYVEYDAITPEAIQVKREGNASTLRIRYERRVPFIHNIELLATFDKTVSLSGNG